MFANVLSVPLPQELPNRPGEDHLVLVTWTRWMCDMSLRRYVQAMASSCVGKTLCLGAAVAFLAGCGGQQAQEERARVILDAYENDLLGVTLAHELMRTAKRELQNRDPSDVEGIRNAVELYNEASAKYLELGERVKKDFARDCQEAGIPEHVAQKIWSEGLREREFANGDGGISGAVPPSGRAKSSPVREATPSILTGHTDAVGSVAFSPDGNRIVSGSEDNTIRIWDTSLGNELRRFGPESHWFGVQSVAFSPDGEWIVSVIGNDGIRIWDANSGESFRLCVNEYTPMSASFSPDGRRIVSAESRYVRIWDAIRRTEAGRCVGHGSAGLSEIVYSAAFSPDGRIVTAGADWTIRLWDPGTSVPAGILIALPDGRQVPTDGYTAKEIWRIDADAGPIFSVAFSPDGHSVLSASGDNTTAPVGNAATVRLWDATTGSESRRFQGHTGSVRSVAFSRDGRHILSGGSDKTVRLWDSATGVELRRLEGHEEGITSVAFSPDGRHVISASFDSTIRLWDIERDRVSSLMR